MSQPPIAAFDKEQAAKYDSQWKPLAALNGALHLLARSALTKIPDTARILCAGVGTGAELIYFAKTFPRWTFVGFDPSKPMLDVCRERLTEAGIMERCALHEGYVESLPHGEPFDAATAFLVSHFIVNADERGQFFHELAARIAPGGAFVNADLAPDKTDPHYENLMQLWLDTIAIAGMDQAGRERYEEMFGDAVAAQTPEIVERLIADNGFTPPTRFYQAGMVYAWYCHRSGR